MGGPCGRGRSAESWWRKAAGAQTGRRGAAKGGEGFACWRDLTGRLWFSVGESPLPVPVQSVVRRLTPAEFAPALQPFVSRQVGYAAAWTSARPPGRARPP